MPSDFLENTDKFVNFKAGSDATLSAALQSVKDVLERWVKNVQVFASFVLTMELASCG